MIPFAVLPNRTCLRDKDRVGEGIAAPGSPEAAAAVARVRAIVVKEPKRAAREWNSCPDPVSRAEQDREEQG